MASTKATIDDGIDELAPPRAPTHEVRDDCKKVFGKKSDDDDDILEEFPPTEPSAPYSINEDIQIGLKTKKKGTFHNDDDDIEEYPMEPPPRFHDVEFGLKSLRIKKTTPQVLGPPTNEKIIPLAPEYEQAPNDGSDRETEGFTPISPQCAEPSAVQHPGAIHVYPPSHLPSLLVVDDDNNSTLPMNTSPEPNNTSNLSRGIQEQQMEGFHMVEAEAVQEKPLVEAVEAPRGCSLRSRIGIAVSVLVVVGVAVGIAATFGGTRGSRSGDDAETTSAPTFSPTEIESYLAPLLLSRSPFTSFSDPISPESRALAWMLSDNYTLSESLSDNRLIQRFALATLWYSTNGETTWDHGGWLQSINECDWNDPNDDNDPFSVSPDVECYSNRNTVQKLDLNNDRLSGSIPPELSLLSELQVLYLHFDDLTGEIPSVLGKLPELVVLNLHSNHLSGQIPSELDNLSKLESLVVSDNKLNGTVPAELGLLSKLIELWLHHSDLSGSVPAVLCDAGVIVYIDCGAIACSCCQNGSDTTYPYDFC
jgi:Leucine-rich repeat (LRR) protein